MRPVIQAFLFNLALGMILPEPSHAFIKEAFSNLFKRCGTCRDANVCHDQKKLEWCQKNCKPQIQGSVCALPLEGQTPVPPKEAKKLEELHKGKKETMVERFHSSLTGTGDHLFGVLSRHP